MAFECKHLFNEANKNKVTGRGKVLIYWNSRSNEVDYDEKQSKRIDLLFLKSNDIIKLLPTVTTASVLKNKIIKPWTRGQVGIKCFTNLFKLIEADEYFNDLKRADDEVYFRMHHLMERHTSYGYFSKNCFEPYKYIENILKNLEIKKDPSLWFWNNNTSVIVAKKTIRNLIIHIFLVRGICCLIDDTKGNKVPILLGVIGSFSDAVASRNSIKNGIIQQNIDIWKKKMNKVNPAANATFFIPALVPKVSGEHIFGLLVWNEATKMILIKRKMEPMDLLQQIVIQDLSHFTKTNIGTGHQLALHSVKNRVLHHTKYETYDNDPLLDKAKKSTKLIKLSSNTIIIKLTDEGISKEIYEQLQLLYKQSQKIKVDYQYYMQFIKK